MAVPILAGFLTFLAWLMPPVDPGVSPPRANPEALVQFVGEYGFGTGFTSQGVTIGANGSFRSQENGCLGLYDCNGGRAQVIEGRLVLTPDQFDLPRISLYLQTVGRASLGMFSPETRISDGVEELPTASQVVRQMTKTVVDLAEYTWGFRQGSKRIVLVRVVWGERIYLVQERDGQDFCNFVNLGSATRYRWAQFLSGGTDEDRVEDMPQVPDEWKSMLLSKPIEGKVVELLGNDRARVNLGAEQGVWKGMSLAAEGEVHPFEVVQVDARTCIIGPRPWNTHPLKLGQKFSSRSPDPVLVREEDSKTEP